jgi:hypothetical protein
MEIAFENFAKSWLVRPRGSSGATPSGGIVNRKGCTIEVAFKLKAGFLDEAFVFGIVRNWRQLLYCIQTPKPAQVDIEERVAAGQEAGWFGGSMFPQLYDDHDRRGHQHNP